jgi:hypothetical protein
VITLLWMLRGWWRRATRPIRLWWIQRRITAKARRIDDSLRAKPRTTVSFDRVIKDRYPAPGDRIKQYVVDEQRERAWEQRTCPHVGIGPHLDDDGEACMWRNAVAGDALWCDLDRNVNCSFCRLAGDRAQHRHDIAAWRVMKAQRPPICEDRDKFSEEIAPPLGDLRDNPLLTFVRERRQRS